MVVRASSAAALARNVVTGVTNDILGTPADDWFEAFAKGNITDTRNTARLSLGDDRLYASAIALGEMAAINKAFGGFGDDELRFYTESHGSAWSEAVGGPGDDLIALSQLARESASLNGGIFDGGNGNDFLDLNVQGVGVGVSLLSLGGLGHDRQVSLVHGDGDITNTQNGGPGSDRLRAEATGTGDVLQTLYGRAGRDALNAVVWEDGKSVLLGGLGDDRLTVTGGHLNDLNGGRGNDLLRLGDGEDIIRFNMLIDAGDDVVQGFNGAVDQISLNGWDGTATVTDDGTDALVTFDNGSSLLFRGVGDGTMDDIYDLVDDPGQITDTWL